MFVERDFQFGLVGRALERPLRVLVSDEDGAPVENARVSFTVVGGGGSRTCRWELGSR
jgi:hypothetical protein